VPRRDAILGAYLSAANAFGYSGSLVWQVRPCALDSHSRPLLAHARVQSPWACLLAGRVATLCLGAQIFPWPTDNLTGAGFDFDYDKPGAATMLATFAATHARNRLATQLESNGGLL
jgi:hypothetical protein